MRINASVANTRKKRIFKLSFEIRGYTNLLKLIFESILRKFEYHPENSFRDMSIIVKKFSLSVIGSQNLKSVFLDTLSLKSVKKFSFFYVYLNVQCCAKYSVKFAVNFYMLITRAKKSTCTLIWKNYRTFPVWVFGCYRSVSILYLLRFRWKLKWSDRKVDVGNTEFKIFF